MNCSFSWSFRKWSELWGDHDCNHRGGRWWDCWGNCDTDPGIVSLCTAVRTLSFIHNLSWSNDETRFCPTTCMSAPSLHSHLTVQLHRLACQGFYPWASPGKNTGVGCYALLQRILPTQGLNQSLIPPASSGGFFSSSSTWEALNLKK